MAIKRLKTNLSILVEEQGDDTTIVLYDNVTFDIKGAGHLHRTSVNTHRIFSIEKGFAQRGYGPLTGLVLINHSGINGTVVSLNGDITPRAEEVWKQFYNGEGKEWVEVEKFDHPVHDAEWLNVKLRNNFIIPGLQEAISRSNNLDTNQRTTLIDDAIKLIEDATK